MATLFQWLRDSPRLYLRSPLHLNECIERLQDAIVKGEKAFPGISAETPLGGRLRWHSFAIYPLPRGWLAPTFHGRLLRLENGTQISGYFSLNKYSRFRLLVLALGLSSFFVYLPQFVGESLYRPTQIGGWIVAAAILIGAALMNPVGESMISVFVDFFADVLEAELVSRKE